MNLFIYSIYDKVSGSYGDLKLFTNEATAQRWFNNFASESPFGNDLSLYKLGKYDTLTGAITEIDIAFVMNFVQKVVDNA